MQFSDSSTKQGLVEDITFLTGMDTTQYATADRVRNVNRWLMHAVSVIMRADAAWEFDDTDKTDLPTLTTTLVASQEDYELPKSLTTNVYTLQGDATAGAILKVHRVEVKDANGIWTKLKQFDQSEIDAALEEWKKTAGIPTHYDVRGGSLFLKPAPATGSVTMTAGLKVYITREPDAFTASDTTKEPGFVELYHRILSYGASLDWFVKSQQADRAAEMKESIGIMENGLREFYGGRNRDKQARIVPRSLKNGRQFI